MSWLECFTVALPPAVAPHAPPSAASAIDRPGGSRDGSTSWPVLRSGTSFGPAATKGLAGSLTVGLAVGLALRASGSGRNKLWRRWRQADGRPAAGQTATAALGGWPRSAVGFAADPSEVLKTVQWPPQWPYTADDMRRADESTDAGFYDEPRLCTHIDDGAIGALRKYYAQEFPKYPQARILDICSSWVSHYPENKTWSHVSITGMNEYELSQNRQADDYTVRDLNKNPQLPYGDESFDVVTCTVSFDYLNKPLEVMREVARVLRPGGTVILSTSNRCFPTKAVNVWLQAGDAEHILIYGSYIHYSGAFEAPFCKDITPSFARMGFGDPMYVVQAVKRR